MAMKKTAGQKNDAARELTAPDVRIRLLEMVYRHDKPPAELIARAAELERWIAART